MGEPQPGAVREIVDPPWHEHIDVPDRGVCPGRWGPRRLLLADERHLQLMGHQEQRRARSRAKGRELGPLPMYEPPALPPENATD